MQLEELFDGLRLDVEPLALCVASCGWRLRLPASDHATVHFALDGEGLLRIAGGPSLDLRAGQLAIVPARNSHSIQGTGAAAHETIVLPHDRTTPGLRRLVAGPAGPDRLVVACGALQARYVGGIGIFELMREPLVHDFSRSREMRRTFGRLLEESEGGAAGSLAMIGALMQECLVLLFRELCEDASCSLPWLRGLDDPRLRSVIATVVERPQDDHSLTSLATSAGMSRSAFSRDFARGLGLTPGAFIRQVRAQRAAQLLRGTDLTVEAIAHRVGFTSRSHFTEVFGQVFGQPPSEYRAAHRADSRPEAAAGSPG